MICDFPKDQDILLVTSDYYGDESQYLQAGIEQSFLITDNSSARICMLGVRQNDTGALWNSIRGKNQLKWDDCKSAFSDLKIVTLSASSKANAWASINNEEMYQDFLMRFPIKKLGQRRDLITIKSYARVGLMGNPSDGFFGKTISFLIKNFCAQVTLLPHEDPTNEQIVIGERIIFSCFQSVLESVKVNGYDGISRLILATLKVFFSHTADHEKCKLGFTIFYETNIPRQVGLSGSSAIITGLIKALVLYYDIEIRPEILANLALSVEKDELKIAAGLQDRVIQTYGGLVYMDFNKEQMQKYGYGIYEPLSLSKLPSLWIAYCSNPKDSGKVHSNISQ